MSDCGTRWASSPAWSSLVLVAMSLYSLAITGERLRAFWRGRKQSRLYIAALAPMVEGDGPPARGRRAGQALRGQPGGQRHRRGPDRVRARRSIAGRAPPAFEVAEVVNRAMERSKERELAGLRRGMPVLATVASSAPFVGLFGTVGGIITAFQKLADPTKGGGGIGTVSAGIAEALVTTAVGLGVAIIAVWFYNYFTARLDDITIDIDETASELVDTILRGHPA